MRVEDHGVLGGVMVLGKREYDSRGLARDFRFLVGDASELIMRDKPWFGTAACAVPSQSTDSKLLVALLSSSGRLLIESAHDTSVRRVLAMI